MVNTRMTALATDQSNDPSASIVTGVGLAAGSSMVARGPPAPPRGPPRPRAPPRGGPRRPPPRNGPRATAATAADITKSGPSKSVMI